jgi:hypothetical protein
MPPSAVFERKKRWSWKETEGRGGRKGAGRDREVRCVHIGGMLVRDVMCLLVHMGDTCLLDTFNGLPYVESRFLS